MNTFFGSSLVTNEHNLYYPYSLLGVKIIQSGKPHLGGGVVLLEKADPFFLVFHF